MFSRCLHQRSSICVNVKKRVDSLDSPVLIESMSDNCVRRQARGGLGGLYRVKEGYVTAIASLGSVVQTGGACG